MRRLTGFTASSPFDCPWLEIYVINIGKKERKMKVKKIFLCIVCLSFSLSVFSQDADELIGQADDLYLEMKDLPTAKEARDLYLRALEVSEDKYEANWKLSRILYYVGDNTEEKKEKKEIFKQAIEYAKKAVELEPEKPDGYYWLGVNYGVYGEARGVMKSLFLVDDVKGAMNKVIALDRSYEDGGPDRVLGRVFFKVPGIAGGSKKKSRMHLEKSLEFGPNDPLTRYYLAQTLYAQNEVEKSRAELDFILNMEDDERWVAGINDCKKDAEEMLKKKKFKKQK